MCSEDRLRHQSVRRLVVKCLPLAGSGVNCSYRKTTPVVGNMVLVSGTQGFSVLGPMSRTQHRAKLRSGFVCVYSEQ